ncbi:PREDICTED: fructokinase-like 2, chloroplastic [Lupinus angustifolius]|uniref:fructokinase-like 2, chloroplastic n=1 Tax=Lupinus angustifolius TaxID=3871 RepID=UPI00092EDB62|nr:PREDICTED: fructokinase-like 2, chloroplastic [Lupinus angustifolius]
MACLSFSHFLSLPRCQLTWSYGYASFEVVQLRELRSRFSPGHVAMARKKASQDSSIEESNEYEPVAEKKTTRSSKTKSATTRTKKKSADESFEENMDLLINIDSDSIEGSSPASSDISKKKTPRTRRKDASISADVEGENELKEENKVRRGRPKVKNVITEDNGSEAEINDQEKKKVRRRGRPKKESVIREEKGSDSEINDQEEKKIRSRRRPKEENVIIEDTGSEAETGDVDEPSFIEDAEEESDDGLELIKYDGEDISYTYGWPPLVCCFGSAQNAFMPSGRPANRLIDHEIHERMKDALWSPENFYRAPGGCAASVAVALANLGGKVALMGKLGDDEYGQVMLYHLNTHNVQTRSIRIDSKRATAVSLMKVGKRSRLKMSCVKPCAEDCLTKSEINIDVLKEAKMFYFSTHSLLDRNMRSTTLQAIRIAKKFGAVVFYDVNLPMPLWNSSEETKTFIRQVWNHADIIEVTKQELEFLCGIMPTEEFDTKNNDISKFVHYEPEVIAPLWHEDLKILFVTNGTSKIHYYTKEFDGALCGMEDAPITPFTCDMSASGDGIVAGLMRMLTVQPDLITDKGYLEHSIKHAINCGVIDQWILAQRRGFPPREGSIAEVTPNAYGIRSVTEREYRTIGTPDDEHEIELPPEEERVYHQLDPVS